VANHRKQTFALRSFSGITVVTFNTIRYISILGFTKNLYLIFNKVFESLFTLISRGGFLMTRLRPNKKQDIVQAATIPRSLRRQPSG
jgi:hypothetical protein